MSLISLKSDKVDFFLRNPARRNFEGRNVKEDVDENQKNFGYLILDPNRTPIQMCLALARKSRKMGHPRHTYLFEPLKPRILAMNKHDAYD